MGIQSWCFSKVGKLYQISTKVTRPYTYTVQSQTIELIFRVTFFFFRREETRSTCWTESMKSWLRIQICCPERVVSKPTLSLEGGAKSSVSLIVVVCQSCHSNFDYQLILSWKILGTDDKIRYSLLLVTKCMWSWGNHLDNHHHHHHHHHSSTFGYIFQKSAIFHRLQFQLTNLCSFFAPFLFFVYTCISVYSKTHLLSVLCIEILTFEIKMDTINITLCIFF